MPDKGGIADWPEADRPRERLLRCGEHSLSNSELLAILLRTGTAGQSALDLARAVLARFVTFRQMSHTDPADWQGIKGLGPAKIAQIKAALEIGRRFREDEAQTARARISGAGDAAALLMPRLRDLRREVFKAVFLDACNAVIEIHEVDQGTVNQANPVVRELFQRALQVFAVSVICAHNHPSGQVSPSPQDRDFTRRLRAAGAALDIRVLDHIIIGDNRYYSFADSGQLD